MGARRGLRLVRGGHGADDGPPDTPPLELDEVAVLAGSGVERRGECPRLWFRYGECAGVDRIRTAAGRDRPDLADAAGRRMFGSNTGHIARIGLPVGEEEHRHHPANESEEQRNRPQKSTHLVRQREVIEDDPLAPKPTRSIVPLLGQMRHAQRLAPSAFGRF